MVELTLKILLEGELSTLASGSHIPYLDVLLHHNCQEGALSVINHIDRIGAEGRCDHGNQFVEV